MISIVPNEVMPSGKVRCIDLSQENERVVHIIVSENSLPPGGDMNANLLEISSAGEKLSLTKGQWC